MVMLMVGGGSKVVVLLKGFTGRRKRERARRETWSLVDNSLSVLVRLP
jgi:hypothetical protein